jgi:glycosyltransferase involved in cell wall biosynthesis
LHAPSSTATKGSALILEGVNSLRAQGLPIELTLILNSSAEKVLSAMLESDVLIDQVNIGWYGVLAVEGMMTGLPTIARLTSRNRHIFIREVQRQIDKAPICVGDIDDLERKLVALAACEQGDQPRWREMSRSASAFASEVHGGPNVARRLLDDYGVALSSRRVG